jgi:hypothetical protein
MHVATTVASGSILPVCHDPDTNKYCHQMRKNGEMPTPFGFGSS